MEIDIANRVDSLKPVKIDSIKVSELRNYFVNTWDLYETLFSAIQSDETFYESPDPLRNPLIFYWGHTAAFYINKFVLAGVLDKGVNAHYEDIFARGVDPATDHTWICVGRLQRSGDL